MENRAAFRFSLRGLFVCAAFVGLGLLALMNPHNWVLSLLTLTHSALFVYAVVVVLASTGARRLFWAAFASSMLLADVAYFDAWQAEFSNQLTALLHPDLDDGLAFGPEDPFYVCSSLLSQFLTLAVSVVLAYVIPYLVQRGQKAQCQHEQS